MSTQISILLVLGSKEVLNTLQAIATSRVLIHTIRVCVACVMFLCIMPWRAPCCGASCALPWRIVAWRAPCRGTSWRGVALHHGEKW